MDCREPLTQTRAFGFAIHSATAPNRYPAFYVLLKSKTLDLNPRRWSTYISADHTVRAAHTVSAHAAAPETTFYKRVKCPIYMHESIQEISTRHTTFFRIITMNNHNAQNTPLISRKAFTTSRIVAALALFIAATTLLVANAGWLPRFMAPPSANEVELALRQAGLGPEQLTAAGTDSIGIERIIQNAFAHLDNNVAYTSAARNLGLAKAEYQDLFREVRSGVATDQQQADFTAATVAYDNAKTAWATAQANLVEAVTAEQTTSQRTIIQQLAANQRWQALPLEFSVIERTEPQWIDLREALANERISADLGETPDPEATTLLSQLRANPTVATAAANLNTNLNTNMTAWNNELGE